MRQQKLQRQNQVISAPILNSLSSFSLPSFKPEKKGWNFGISGSFSISQYNVEGITTAVSSGFQAAIYTDPKKNRIPIIYAIDQLPNQGIDLKKISNNQLSGINISGLYNFGNFYVVGGGEIYNNTTKTTTEPINGNRKYSIAVTNYATDSKGNFKFVNGFPEIDQAKPTKTYNFGLSLPNDPKLREEILNTAKNLVDSNVKLPAFAGNIAFGMKSNNKHLKKEDPHYYAELGALILAFEGYKLNELKINPYALGGLGFNTKLGNIFVELVGELNSSPIVNKTDSDKLFNANQAVVKAAFENQSLGLAELLPNPSAFTVSNKVYNEYLYTNTTNVQFDLNGNATMFLNQPTTTPWISSKEMADVAKQNIGTPRNSLVELGVNAAYQTPEFLGFITLLIKAGFSGFRIGGNSGHSNVNEFIIPSKDNFSPENPLYTVQPDTQVATVNLEKSGIALKGQIGFAFNLNNAFKPKVPCPPMGR
jgi:hypothetical protein